MNCLKNIEKFFCCAKHVADEEVLMRGRRVGATFLWAAIRTITAGFYCWMMGMSAVSSTMVLFDRRTRRASRKPSALGDHSWHAGGIKP